ncbi:hypothetical protein E2C01_087623 [Portunus trituberculatus]|uniref:Uncharacterized protein n=1 Tax=Portunus trituberculatus TaxID=210409 RepID=A0A5B7J730_PORTR|nr:hypothetical protein [Portunus trituberculatus]
MAWHRSFLEKLHDKGNQGGLLRLLGNYLQQRSFKVIFQRANIRVPACGGISASVQNLAHSCKIYTWTTYSSYCQESQPLPMTAPSFIPIPARTCCRGHESSAKSDRRVGCPLADDICSGEDTGNGGFLVPSRQGSNVREVIFFGGSTLPLQEDV